MGQGTSNYRKIMRPPQTGSYRDVGFSLKEK